MISLADLRKRVAAGQPLTRAELAELVEWADSAAGELLAAHTLYAVNDLDAAAADVRALLARVGVEARDPEVPT